MNDERLERQIKAALERDARSLPSGLRARVSAIPDEFPRERRWPRFTQLVAAAGALAAVLVLAVAALVLVGLHNTTIGPAASATPSGPPSTQAAVLPSAAASLSPATPASSPEATPSVLSTPFTAAGFNWEPLLPRTGNLSTPVITPLVPGEFVAATLPHGSGYVAVGFHEADAGASADADAWYSTDGAHFLHATIEGGTDATMDGLTLAPDGTFVAIGTDGYSPNTQDITTRGTAIWTSRDGRAWTRQPAQASLQGALLQHVVREGSTYIAGGQSPVGVPHLPAGAPQPPIWTSSDAVHWDRVAASPIFPSSQGRLLVNGLAWTGSRVVAVGNLLGGTRPYAWTSRDGRTWAATDMSSTFPAAPTGGATPTGVAVVGSTLLAVGWFSGAATEPVAWLSSDGTKWTRVDLPSFLAGILLSGIDVSGGEVTVHGEQLDSGGQIPQGTPLQWTLTAAPSATASLGLSSAAATATVAACTLAQLQVSIVDSYAAAGTVGAWLRFLNTSTTTCGLRGWPTLIGVTATGAQTTAREAGVQLPAVALKPGEDAFADYSAGDNPLNGNPCPAPYHTLRVGLPGSDSFVSLPAYNAWDAQDQPACGGFQVTQIEPASAAALVLPLRP